MYLENVVFDAVDPRRLGRFWETALGCTQLTDEPAGYETRLTIEGRPVLDLCFQHLDVRLEAGEDADDVAASIAERGGARLHRPEWGALPWRSYTDPSGNEFCVLPASS